GLPESQKDGDKKIRALCFCPHFLVFPRLRALRFHRSTCCVERAPVILSRCRADNLLLRKIPRAIGLPESQKDGDKKIQDPSSCPLWFVHLLSVTNCTS